MYIYICKCPGLHAEEGAQVQLEPGGQALQPVLFVVISISSMITVIIIIIISSIISLCCYY